MKMQIMKVYNELYGFGALNLRSLQSSPVFAYGNSISMKVQQ